MNKTELKATLDKYDIVYDADMTNAQLEALIPEGVEADDAVEEEASNSLGEDEPTGPVISDKLENPSMEKMGDFEVGDPQVLRPVELPLVIKPVKGKSWKNDAQEEYSRVLNGYAYKNPTKWGKKKEVLIARLTEIGNDPEALNLYRGGESRVTFSNKAIQVDK